MLNFHKNHKNFIITAVIGFSVLSIIVAIIPAYQMEEYEPLPNQKDLTKSERSGLNVYISEGCVGCHTQQVRNIEMDNVWGSRPSLASDYFYSKKRMDIWRQSPSLLGSERTGPDLTNVGVRQPSEQWHLLHLYNPRSVVKESIMPSYPWLFEQKDSAYVTQEDIILPNDATQNKEGQVTVATKKGRDLVAYLKSLRQVSLMPETTSPTFIPSIKQKEEETQGGISKTSLNGEALYKNTCAACHQTTGQGVKGAFPPLSGSPIVNDDNPELFIEIILTGYDARPEYGQMPAFGDQLSNEEILAIINHERTSWKNNSKKITLEEVEKVRKLVEEEQNK